MPQNTPEHSPSEEDDSLAELAESIRAGGGVKGSTFIENFEKRSKTGEFLTEQELASRIEQTESGIDSLKYSSALERAMYTAVIERMRLRLQMTHGRIDSDNPQNEHDFSVLQDLDRRITYAQYEEDAVDDFLDATEEYEQYRIEFNLDRPVSEGGIPRNNVLEDQLRKQLSSLNKVLPRMGDVRKLRYYEFKATLSPENEDVQAKIKQLKGEIPKEFSGSSKLFYDHLEQELRIVLGYTSDVTTPKNLTTPTPHLLHRDAIERHFDQVLNHRKQLAGRTGQSAEDEKNSLKEEHAKLLDHALSYNIQSVSRLTAIISHLTAEGHIDQPIQDPPSVESPKQQFGLLGDREAISKERDRKIDDLENYMKHFRTNVLREDRRVDVPIVGSVPLDPSLIIEDLMTTHVIPAKLLLAESVARGATIPWEAQDMIANAVGLDFDIRESRTQAILSPIYERLGLPENYSELTDTQKREARHSPEVQKRLASVKKIIDEFRVNQESVLQGIESDISLLRELISLKQPSELALVMEPEVPTEMPKLSDLNTDEKIAGAYIFLLERISSTRVSDLNLAQQQFMNKINENLSLNIDVADVEMQLGTVWIREWAMSIGAIVGEGMAAYYVVRRGVPAALRQALRIRLPVGAIAAVAMAEGTMVVLKGVAHQAVYQKHVDSINVVTKDLLSLQQGTDRTGRPLSPDVQKQLAEQAGNQLFASMLTILQVAKASNNPFLSERSFATPQPELMLEAHVYANQTLNAFGFPDYHTLPRGFPTPENPNRAKIDGAETPSTEQLLSSTYPPLVQPEQRLTPLLRTKRMDSAYDRFKKTADRKYVLKTVGAVIGTLARFDERLRPRAHPTGFERVWRGMTGARAPEVKDLLTRDDLTRMHAVFSGTVEEMLLSFRYLEEHPPTDVEIQKWYKDAGVKSDITPKMIQGYFGSESDRKQLFTRCMHAWITLNEYRVLLSEEPSQ